MRDYDTRFFPTREVRAEQSDGGAWVLRGYFTKFGSLSVDLGGFVERIEPTAFRADLETGDVFALWNHDSNYVLGSSGEASTLKLGEDDIGNTFAIQLADTQLVRDMVLSPVQRRDVTGVSFGFRTLPDGDKWDEMDDGRLRRTVVNARLREVSPGVAFPGYTENDATVARRSLDAWLQTRDTPTTERLRRARLRLRAAQIGIDSNIVAA